MEKYRGVFIIEKSPPMYAGFQVRRGSDGEYLRRGFDTEAQAQAWCDRKIDNPDRGTRPLACSFAVAMKRP